MSSTIQIKFLSLDEMANARDIDERYENVGVDNLGFADKDKNRVYVRAGLEPQLQTLLIDHELSHLFELEGTDEDEHGIRHKKKGGFMKIFMPIIGAILGSILMPGVGTALGLGGLGGAAGLGAATGVGSMLGGVAGSSATGKPNWLGNAVGGAASGVGAGLGSLASGGLPSGAGITMGQGAGGGSGAFSEVLGQTAGNGLSQATNSALGSAGSLMGQGAGQATGSSLGNIGSLAGSAFGNMFSGALGSGQSAQGGYGGISQSYKMPDLSQQANANPQYSGWSENAYVPEMSPQIGQQAVQSSTGVSDRGGLVKMPWQQGLGQAGIALQGQSASQGFGYPFKSDVGGGGGGSNMTDPFGLASGSLSF